jgi:hypothetical protein
MILERTSKAMENPWRWVRQDPSLGRAMQTILVTGEGGDIITAMRGMNPQAVFETVAVAFGDLCDDATKAYHAARSKADEWSFWQLILGIATILAIIITMAMTLLGLPAAAAGTTAVSLVTGAATMWFDKKVDENRAEAEERFQDMVKYCSQSKLIMQLGAVLTGLDPEQQEAILSAVLALKV